ncbi:unnamed protein product, partial [Rotaria sp. Silwood1]
MTSLSTIKRRAIDPNGNNGSVYDIYEDRVIQPLNITGKKEKTQVLNSIQCKLIDSNTEKSRNLLKWINIDDDLRLQILVNPQLQNGVAALCNHYHPIDQYTRFMYFFYAHHETKLPEDPVEVKELLVSIILDSAATHIVSAVSFGIDVVIVLQLPQQNNITQQIDVALEKVRSQLTNSGKALDYTENDASLLNKITVTKVYSNIAELREMTSFLKICHFIDEPKEKREKYRPCEYTLRPMEWLYGDARWNQQSETILSHDELPDNNQPALSTELKKEKNVNNQYSSLPNKQVPPTDASITSLSKSILQRTNNTINILLLGESGVGKSTFINAFVNYLIYKTLETAEQDKPVVLIPVSFLITTGSDFHEHTVKFGDPDSYHNEDFDHPGQSVTQKCKSYVFHLNHINTTKIRIIDTPGFGDTRGVHQDDANMQHILEYINDLTHLDAICFLLKPNTSKINYFFVTCLNQLLDFLGSTARENIIFCFTNARSTFYTPGDTVPLLKSILKSLKIGE